MEYEEFSEFEKISDPTNPFCNGYKTKEGAIFFIEPGFYVGLMGFKDRRGDEYKKIIDAMIETANKEKNVIFCGDFENPFMEKEGFIYREIQDLSDPLQIYVEDKNRPSDYGD
ncbi:MAG: hypothetical protein IJ247_04010 [Bacilli bacterium]|nr:hypothetical protein [Bacilli bacterium]